MKRGKYITQKKYAWKKIIGAFLLITLILTVIYSIIRITNAPHEAEALDESIRVKSDYMLMLSPVFIGFISYGCTFLNREKVDDFHTKPHVYTIFCILYCAIYLGR